MSIIAYYHLTEPFARVPSTGLGYTSTLIMAPVYYQEKIYMECLGVDSRIKLQTDCLGIRCHGYLVHLFPF